MTATFFGHADTPQDVEILLHSTLIYLIEKQNVSSFYVGNNGNFDAMVQKQLEQLSKIYNIKYCVVLAYYPTKNSLQNNELNTIFPERIETIPKRFAISWRNKWMIKQSDIVVTYVKHNFGGAAQFKELAQKQGKQVLNLAFAENLNSSL